jgi:hypothetical protein
MKYDYETFTDTVGNPQTQFNTQVRGIGWFLKWIKEAFIYLPLLTIGYLTATKILTAKNDGLVWIITILLVAFAAYFMLVFLKGILLELRKKHNPLWLLLFVFCIGITCLMTPWLAYQPISTLFIRWGWPHWLTWTAVFIIGMTIYLRYDFLDHRQTHLK